MNEPRSGLARLFRRPTPNAALPRASVDGNTKFGGGGIVFDVGSGETNGVSWYENGVLVGFIRVSVASPTNVMLFGGAVTTTLTLAAPVTITNLNLFNVLATQLPKTLANGANNDVNVGDAPVCNNLITGPTGAFNITGFANGTDGNIILIANGTNQVMTLRDNNAGSAVGNRILTGTGADVATNHAMLVYDVTNTVWRLY